MGVTLRFQSTGAIPGDGRPVKMRGESLTIGRSPENDLVLPDPDGTLSRRHCVIEDTTSGVIVIDISSNGTFLNYDKSPIGTTPTIVNDGDILQLGGYELVIDIGEDILDPLADGPISHGIAAAAPSRQSLMDATAPGEADFLDDLLGNDKKPKGPGRYIPEDDDDGLLPPLGEDPLLAPAEDPLASMGASEADHVPAHHGSFSASSSSSTMIPDDWDDDFLKPEGGVAPTIPPAQQIPAEPTPLTNETVGPAPTANPPAPSAAPPAVQRSDLVLRAFLEGAGASHLEFDPGEVGPAMARIGAAYREMVEGMREVLMTRASIKGEFRINQTTLNAGRNNPLKFSTSADKALLAMVKPPEKGYLPADDAAHEAMKDIRAHEVAMLSGMEAALKGLLKRLDPNELAGKIEKGGGVGGLLKGKKARYWEVYEDMYSQISEEAEEDFQELFAKEFARAYQAQMDKLKR